MGYKIVKELSLGDIVYKVGAFEPQEFKVLGLVLETELTRQITISGGSDTFKGIQIGASKFENQYKTIFYVDKRMAWTVIFNNAKASVDKQNDLIAKEILKLKLETQALVEITRRREQDLSNY